MADLLPAFSRWRNTVGHYDPLVGLLTISAKYAMAFRGHTGMHAAVTRIT
jgi:hypothetical protein